MAPRKKVAAKKKAKRTARVSLTKKRQTPSIAALSGQARLQLLVWDAYEDPKLFKDLLAAREDLEKLKQVTAAYGFGDRELAALQKRLKDEKAQVDLAQFMTALHTYTRPKVSRPAIIRELGLIRPPWAPWDPVLEPDVPGADLKGTVQPSKV